MNGKQQLAKVIVIAITIVTTIWLITLNNPTGFSASFESYSIKAQIDCTFAE